MKSKITGQDKLFIKPNISYRSLGDETVLLNLDTNIYYSLNSTAKFFWDNLEEYNSVNAAAQLMQSRYDAPADRISQDLLELANDLFAEGFVTVH
jgi:hypothetical protein